MKFRYILAVTIVLAAVGITSGLIENRSVGLCFGQCDRDRFREFKAASEAWIALLVDCGLERRDEQQEIFATFFPGLAQLIARANEEFETLARKEDDGSLTVGERDAYESNQWRVKPSPNSFQMFTDVTMSSSVKDRLVEPCSREGFIGYRGEISFCMGYAQAIDWNHGYTWEDAYKNAKNGTGIEVLLARMRSNLAAHRAAADRAESEVATLPAAKIDHATVKSEVERRTRNYSCRYI